MYLYKIKVISVFGDDKPQDPVLTKSNMSDELLKLKNQTERKAYMLMITA